MRDPRYFELKGRAAENVLHGLALQTFLTDWCYVNPKLPDGKELCDLLVVFDDVAIIWQVKDLQVRPDGRYNQAEVEKNLRQLRGARRRLIDLKTTIELENPRRGRERFDASAIRQVFLIAAFLGESQEFFRAVDDANGTPIHIFDAEFTEILLRELDTASDFIEYLRSKESMLKNRPQLMVVGGEQELLAFYLINDRSFERLQNVENVVIEEGSWEHFCSTPEYQAKKKADEISYLWDSMIDRAHEGSSKYERVARELARPGRFMRRYLAKVFFEAAVNAHRDTLHDLYRRAVATDGVTYCLLFADDPEPRQRRRDMLGAFCFVARGVYQNNQTVIGIATEKKIRPTCTYDFCLLQIPEWTDEDQRHMRRIQELSGILANPQIGSMSEEEYPGANS